MERRADPEEAEKAAADPEYRAVVLYASWQAERQPELLDLRLWVARKKPLNEAKTVPTNEKRMKPGLVRFSFPFIRFIR